ncbi:MAG: HAD family phosphatase [Ruminococcaceae bacterium]|nr:HAD family phosphatase [Oscillospiraceae bacterium]
MIQNVIFDYGMVLVRFDPAYMVGAYVSDPADAALLAAVVFDRVYWDRLDAGTVEDEEVLAACRTRLPERLWEAADTIYYNWVRNLPEIAGMGALIRDLKARGVRCFLLSNISRYFAAHSAEAPLIAELEDCVFSAVCGLQKPDPAIFAHACEQFGVAPFETVFVDDRAENVASAEACGLQGYVFDGDAAALREFLCNR